MKTSDCYVPEAFNLECRIDLKLAEKTLQDIGQGKLLPESSYQLVEFELAPKRFTPKDVQTIFNKYIELEKKLSKITGIDYSQKESPEERQKEYSDLREKVKNEEKKLKELEIEERKISDLKEKTLTLFCAYKTAYDYLTMNVISSKDAGHTVDFRKRVLEKTYLDQATDLVLKKIAEKELNNSNVNLDEIRHVKGCLAKNYLEYLHDKNCIDSDVSILLFKLNTHKNRLANLYKSLFFSSFYPCRRND